MARVQSGFDIELADPGHRDGCILSYQIKSSRIILRWNTGKVFSTIVFYENVELDATDFNEVYSHYAQCVSAVLFIEYPHFCSFAAPLPAYPVRSVVHLLCFFDSYHYLLNHERHSAGGCLVSDCQIKFEINGGGGYE